MKVVILVDDNLRGQALTKAKVERFHLLKQYKKPNGVVEKWVD